MDENFDGYFFAIWIELVGNDLTNSEASKINLSANVVRAKRGGFQNEFPARYASRQDGRNLKRHKVCLCAVGCSQFSSDIGTAQQRAESRDATGGDTWSNCPKAGTFLGKRLCILVELNGGNDILVILRKAQLLNQADLDAFVFHQCLSRLQAISGFK